VKVSRRTESLQSARDDLVPLRHPWRAWLCSIRDAGGDSAPVPTLIMTSF
jgi:hypothetical protein